MPSSTILKYETKRQNLYLRVARGHFASANCHSNYYIDVVAQKSRLNEAQAVAEELRSYDGDIYVTGDGYETAHKLLTALGVKLAVTPYLLRSQNAVSIARVAERMHAQGLSVSERELSPTYLRLPQAERERLERENKI